MSKPLVVLSVLIAATAGYFGYRSLRPKRPEELYQLSQVSRHDLEKTVTASGKITSATQVDLKFQTAGQLAWVGVQEGDSVKKWQAIAALDKRSLEKTLQQELIDYSKERSDFEEERQVTYKDKVLTDTIKRILEKNQWDLDRAVLDVELQDLTVKYATLTSPIAGIVTHIDVPVAGVNITPATAVFTVADPNHLLFEAQIDEADIGSIAVGQPAELILDAFMDQPIPLSVDSLDFTATTDSSGSTVYLAKFRLDNFSQLLLRLGLNGEVTITVAQKSQALSIPLSALIETESGTKVQLIKNNQVVEQPVTTGLTGTDLVEITSGLEPGQTIVIGIKPKK